MADSWYVCLGLCDKELKGIEYALEIAVREVVAINLALSQDEIMKVKNRILTYNSKIRGYYRFSASISLDNFMQDEFRVRSVTYNEGV